MRTIMLALVAVASVGGAAAAQPVVRLDDIAIGFGGGYYGFTSPAMRDHAPVEGSWDVLAQFGTRAWLSLEARYAGASGPITPMSATPRGTLVSNAVAIDLRVNFVADDRYQPYAFAGAGYRRYDVLGAAFSIDASGMRDSVGVLEVPVGLGIAFRGEGLVIDLRSGFTAAFGAELVPSAGLHTWTSVGRIGFEL